MCRLSMWKAHQGRFINGTVELLCPTTFLSEFTGLKICCGDEKGIRATVIAQCMNENLRAAGCTSTGSTTL